MGSFNKWMLAWNTVLILMLVVSTASAAPDLEQTMELMAENDYLALYIHPDTTEIAVFDKNAGEIWYSNPPGRNMRQSIAHDVIHIRYDTPTSPDKQMDSYNHSVQLGQAEIIPIEGGVRVEYLFGAEYDPSAVGVPQMVKKGRFEDMLEQLSDRDRSTLLRYYTPIALRKPYPFELKVTSAAQNIEKRLFGDLVIVPLTDGYQDLVDKALAGPDAQEMRRLEEQIAKQRMDTLYGLLEKFTGYLLGSGEGARSPGFRRDIEMVEQLTPNDFAHLRKEPSYLLGRLAPLLQGQVQSIFEKIGYETADLALDHVQNRLDPPVPLLERFFVPVEYRLDGASLVVQVPMAEVVYPIDQPSAYEVNWDADEGEDFLKYDTTKELVTYPLTSISLLRYFGAADTSAEGYILVPDGSGSLIYLNNGKVGETLYSEPVYGCDGALPVSERLPYEKQVNHLPVFGFRQGDKALFAIIEEGEAIAYIRADIARPTFGYNIAYPAFQVTAKSSRRLDQFTQINLYQSRAYRGNITVRYEFLYGEEADYSGMARRYQDYLVSRGKLLERASQQNIPFFLEVLGVVPKVQPVLGVAREVQLPLTTFDQAQAMVSSLLKQGMKNLSLRYSGWMDGGIHHRYPSRVRLAPGLGSSEDLKRLSRFLAEHGAAFFPGVELLTVQRAGVLDGFRPSRDAARAVNGLYAQKPDYDPVTLSALSKPTRYILSPRVLESLVSKFLKEYQELEIPGLALPSVSRELHADLQRDPARVLDRADSQRLVEQELAKLTELGYALQVDGANAFVLPYATSLVNVPQTGSGFNLVDEEVPFLQMVLHGFLDYAGEPVNLAVDPAESVLRAAQTASGLYFLLVWEDPSVLKDTEYAHFLSVEWEHWGPQAAAIYQEYNEALGDLAGERIWAHEKLGPDLTITWFANGDAVVVNFGEGEAVVGEVRVPPKSFQRIRGGEL